MITTIIIITVYRFNLPCFSMAYMDRTSVALNWIRTILIPICISDIGSGSVYMKSHSQTHQVTFQWTKWVVGASNDKWVSQW